MKAIVLALILTGLTIPQAKAEIIPFNIDLNFDGGLSESQESIFSEAESFWEGVIIGYDGNVSFPTGLLITAKAEDIDGTGGILGSAGPSSGYQNRSLDNNLFYASKGNMVFDTSDLDKLESEGTLLSVIIHEMAHVIGFGTLWSADYNNLYNDGTGQYTGAYALAAYKAEFDSSATHVPIELDGGEGTEDAHWDETWGGPQSDIMTGYLEGSVTYSNTTLAAFKDLGYLTVSSLIESTEISDVPVPLISFLSIFGFLFFKNRK